MNSFKLTEQDLIDIHEANATSIRGAFLADVSAGLPPEITVFRMAAAAQNLSEQVVGLKQSMLAGTHH